MASEADVGVKCVRDEAVTPEVVNVGGSLNLGIKTAIPDHETRHVNTILVSCRKNPRTRIAIKLGTGSRLGLIEVRVEVCVPLGEHRYVDPSITLPTHKELIRLEECMPLEEGFKGMKVIPGRTVIIIHIVLVILAVRESYPARSLQVEHVGDSGPRGGIPHQFASIRSDQKRPLLVKETVERAATRASIEPEHHRIRTWAPLGLDKVVMKLFLRGR